MKIPELKQRIRNYPDFPKAGIIFRDISPILAEPKAFRAAIDLMVAKLVDLQFDTILAIDARGFIFGGVLADRLNKKLVLCRKPSKLPGTLLTEMYGYEYDSASLSLQADALKPGEKVLIVDDVLATGSTFLAAHELVAKLGGRTAAIICLVELAYLEGRKNLDAKLSSVTINSIMNLSA